MVKGYRVSLSRVTCRHIKTRVGVLEDGVVTVSKKEAGQGSVISLLLANVYLYYVFDLWAERWRRHEATGGVMIVRYAGFAHEVGRRAALLGRDAQAVRGVCAVVTAGEDSTATVSTTLCPKARIFRGMW